MLPILCYAMILAAWILDLVTPQLFIAAILLNVPIALSSLALQRRFTIGLVVAAEIANAVAGYVNALHDNGRFDAIAVGDRFLLAASFLLVGYMAIKTQQLGRAAGLSDERAEQAHRERRLRLALDRVRASLSPELVRRSVLREAIELMNARRGILIPESTAKSYWYDALAFDAAVNLQRGITTPEVRSLLAKRLDGAMLLVSDDVVARYALETLDAKYGIMAKLARDENSLRILLLRNDTPWHAEDARFLHAFCEHCSNALTQAHLFDRNAEQATLIAEQHRASLERSGVIRDLVYALAHDLRTPLAAAEVTMRQAQGDAYGALPDSYREVLQASLYSNQESQRLVETLLLVARYESGELTLLREPVDLLRVAKDVAIELDATARERGVAIRVDGASEIVFGDVHELHRAMLNLVSNAVTASPVRADVQVTVTRAEGCISVVVEDRGYGVPPEERSALFARFGVGKRRRGSGTGLGLYVVRLIAQKHGGSAHYDPRSEGGSRFSLQFPREKPE